MYLILSFLYVVVLFPTRIRGNSLLIAKLCPGEHCSHQPEHPILDYTHEKGCHCTRHPCWDDDGKIHDCKSDHHGDHSQKRKVHSHRIAQAVSLRSSAN